MKQNKGEHKRNSVKNIFLKRNIIANKLKDGASLKLCCLSSSNAQFANKIEKFETKYQSSMVLNSTIIKEESKANEELFNLINCEEAEICCINTPASYQQETSLQRVFDFINKKTCDVKFFLTKEGISYACLLCLILLLICVVSVAMKYLQIISDHAKTLERFKENNKYFYKLVEQFPDGVIFYSIKEGVIYSNNFIKKLVASIQLKDKKNNDSKQELKLCDPRAILNKMHEKNKDGITLFQQINKIYDEKMQQKPGLTHTIRINKNPFDCCYEGEFLLITSDKKHHEFHVKISCSEFKQEKNCFIIQLSDISERLQVHEAKVADQVKTMMLCSISHELRTPLNQIKGMIELSQRESNIFKIKNYLNIAERASNMLLHKIDDILDYYEIESNKFVSYSKSMSIKVFLSNIDKLMRPQIEDKKLYFSIHISHEICEEVTFDQPRVERVIINLLNNAMKYTQSGFITLIVNKSTPDANSIRFSISDTGCGIPKERQNTLFRLFGKFKDSNEGCTKLGGLGLSISQILLNKLGSELKCESTPKIGTRFYFDIAIPEIMINRIKAPAFEPELMVRLPIKQDHKPSNSFVSEAISKENTKIKEICKPLNRTRSRSKSMTIILKNHKTQNCELDEEECQCEDVDEFDSTDSNKFVQIIPEFGSRFTFREDSIRPILDRKERTEEIKIIGRREAIKIEMNSSSGTVTEKQYDYHSQEMKVKTNRNEIPPVFFKKCNCSPVLIVEDQPINTMILRDFCTILGVKSDDAENGEIAIDRCLEQYRKTCCSGYELILMDLNMPVMDGLKATENILNLKRDGKLSKTLEIIAVTAFASEEQKAKCEKAGINKFVSKPISFNQLTELLVDHHY